MYSLKKNSKIYILWGGENDPIGIAAYYKYVNDFNVVGIIDKDISECKTINGINFFPTNIIHNLDGVIIICRKQSFSSAKWFKNNTKLKLFKDYIPIELFDYTYIDFPILYELSEKNEIVKNIELMSSEHKVCLFHMNCQKGGILYYLTRNEKFMEEYIPVKTIDFFSISEKSQNGEYLCKELWDSADLLLSQSIAEDNNYGEDFSTEKIKKLVKNECRIVLLPVLYFSGYFMQHKHFKKDMFDYFAKNSFVWGDSILDKYAEQGLPLSEIIRRIRFERIIEHSSIEKRFNDNFNELKRREKNLDVKMCDWIEKNAYNEILFYSVNHPKNIVLKELTKRVLVNIGVYVSTEEVSFIDEEIVDNFECLKIACEAVYPDVIRFCFGKSVNEFGGPENVGRLQYQFITNHDTSFEMYIKMYMSSVHHYKLIQN